jgi:hypothetical protein
MFYVAPASGGPTYINVKMPKGCGAWKLGANAHYCRVRGPSTGKAGKDTSFECRGGDNGAGTAVLKTEWCGRIVIGTQHGIVFGQERHYADAVEGYVFCERTNGYRCTDTTVNTLPFVVKSTITTLDPWTTFRCAPWPSARAHCRN